MKNDIIKTTADLIAFSSATMVLIIEGIKLPFVCMMDKANEISKKY